MSRLSTVDDKAMGHGPPGDRNPALAQNLDDLVIAQRRAAVLVLHRIQNGLFHADVPPRVTGRGFKGLSRSPL
jgi:hypothetical protein